MTGVALPEDMDEETIRASILFDSKAAMERRESKKYGPSMQVLDL